MIYWCNFLFMGLFINFTDI